MGGLRITGSAWSSIERAGRRAAHSARVVLRKELARLQEPVRIHSRAAFVVGCQRSGTTALARAIGEHPFVDLHHETSEQAFEYVRIRPRADTQRIITKSRARVVLFKPICDSQNILRLLLDHNDSKAIWIYRRFEDVARSCVRVWGSHFVHAMRTILTDRRQATWYAEFLPADRETQLAGLVSPNMSPHTGAALLWWLRNALYFDLGLDRDPRVLLVSYEALTASPLAGLTQILQFLGLPWHESVLDGIGERVDQNPDDLVIDDRVSRVAGELARELEAARLKRCREPGPGVVAFSRAAAGRPGV